LPLTSTGATPTVKALRRLLVPTLFALAAACPAGGALAQTPAPAPPKPEAAPRWEAMPRLQLEAQFAGPLRDTIIQRWRDGEGTVCYVYLPITAQHSPPTPAGYVQYGPNAIGSISCVPAPAAKPPAPARR
jgi:hypothetical protein